MAEIEEGVQSMVWIVEDLGEKVGCNRLGGSGILTVTVTP